MHRSRKPEKPWAFALYVLLAFSVSWGAIILSVGPAGLPASADQIGILVAAMLLGPSVAGIVSIGVVSGKNGFRDLASRLTRLRSNIRWYAAAILIAPLSTALVLLVLSLFFSEFASAYATSDDKIVLVLMWIAGGVIVAFFEELGWSGFAIPRLRNKYPVFTTGLLIGAIWGAWHFLVNWESDTFSGLLPFALLLARLFTWLPAYRILMSWVYDRTESLFIAIVMHLSLVATTGILDPVLDGENLLIFLLAKAAVLWAVVLVVFAQRRCLLNGSLFVRRNSDPS